MDLHKVDNKLQAASFSAFTASAEKKETALMVSVEKNQTKSTVSVEKKKETEAVQLVSRWALLNAAIFVGSFAFVYAIDELHINLPWWWVHGGTELTGAAAVEAAVIVCGMALCIPAQAVTAALALLLPATSCRRSRRRALAYVAFSATAAIHIMLARVITLFLATNPVDIYWWAFGILDIVTYGAGDIVCYRALHGLAQERYTED